MPSTEQQRQTVASKHDYLAVSTKNVLLIVKYLTFVTQENNSLAVQKSKEETSNRYIFTCMKLN